LIVFKCHSLELVCFFVPDAIKLQARGKDL